MKQVTAVLILISVLFISQGQIYSKEDREEESDQHIQEGRIKLGIPLSKQISLTFGAGLSRIFDSGKHIDTGETSPLFVAGIEFF